jgi:hypothetical protein
MRVEIKYRRYRRHCLYLAVIAVILLKYITREWTNNCRRRRRRRRRHRCRHRHHRRRPRHTKALGLQALQIPWAVEHLEAARPRQKRSLVTKTSLLFLGRRGPWSLTEHAVRHRRRCFRP